MRHLKETKFTTNAALGRELGRSGASVGAMLAANPKHGPSLDTAARVAALLGVQVAALLEGVEGPASDRAPDRYPARASALRRLAGVLPPEIEQRIRSRVLDEREAPPTELEWLELALLMVRDHQRDERLRRLGRT